MHKIRQPGASGAPEPSLAATLDQAMSADKAAGESPAVWLDQIDIGMVAAIHAFQRWILTLLRDGGFPQLTVIDAVVLDQLKQRANYKRLTDICFILNTEDVHVIGYSLRKLATLGIVDMKRHGKEVTYAIRADSEQRLDRLRAEHEQRLLAAIDSGPFEPGQLADIALRLHRISGLYDRAARAAASLQSD